MKQKNEEKHQKEILPGGENYEIMEDLLEDLPRISLKALKRFVKANVERFESLLKMRFIKQRLKY